MQRHDASSGRELERVARANGHRIVHTTINAIRKNSYNSAPSAETIRAIGWLAGVGDSEAFAAAGRPNPGPPFAEELPPGVDDLSPKERRALIEIMRMAIAQRQEINRYESLTALSSPPQSGAPGEARQDQEAEGKVVHLIQRDQGDDLADEDPPFPEDWEERGAAYRPKIDDAGYTEQPPD